MSPSKSAPRRRRLSRRGASTTTILLGVLSLTLAGLVVLLAGRTRALREQGLRTRAALVTTAPGDWVLLDSVPSLAGGAVSLVTAALPVLPLPGEVVTPTGELTLYLAFAPECPVCNARAPLWRRVVDRAQREAPALRVVALAALQDGSPRWRDSARGFLSRHDLAALPTGWAATRRDQRALTLRSVPQTFIADDAGRVWWAARDSTHTAWLADSLPVLLARIGGGGVVSQGATDGPRAVGGP